MLKKLNLIAIAVLFAVSTVYGADITPEQLRCEYQENPGQLDVANPRLSWINTPVKGKNNLSQQAYELRVATSVDGLKKADAWKTGKVKSAQSLLVRYAGATLKSGTTYYWQVRVWDQNGKASQWSPVAKWTMGMLNESDWKCKWIGAPWEKEEAAKYTNENFPAPLLRKAFSVDRKVKSAHFFGAGLGYFELYINGNRVSDDELAPNFTTYGKRPGIETAGIPREDNFREYRVMYVGYDVTDLIVNGQNAVGAILGNGFYNPVIHWDEPYGTPRFYGQIVIEYTDGTTQVIASDETWRAEKSAILVNGLWSGEVYDARKAHEGWSTASYDDSAWQPVILRKAPYGHLVAQNGPADKITEKFKPVSIKKLGNGKFHVKFPVEISGWAKLSNINGKAGDSIDIKYISESPLGQNKYYIAGKQNESYSARFTWFVFSELEVTGWPGELTSADIEAQAVNSAVATTANFDCSNSLFNTINRIYVRSQLDNMHGSVASDCPHRERTAYTGDGEVACPAAMSNLDAASFYNKWIADVRGSQNVSTGFVPNAAPWQPGAGGGVPWGAAMNIMPWEFYKFYGDVDMLKDNYDAMKGQVDCMNNWRVGDTYVLDKKDKVYWETLGEWVPPFELVSNQLVHTWYYWRCADITARVAKILGNDADAAKYGELASKIKEAFHSTFYDEAKGTYGALGGNIFALAMGVPANREARVIEALKNDIKARDGHLDTGIYGTALFFTTLAKYGMSDLAYEAMNKTDFPSFGWWISQGATTTWECWDGSNSRNHPMFGGGLVWFYRQIAGMNFDVDQPGYKHIVFEPVIPSKITSASYNKVTPYGYASIKWTRADGQLKAEVVVPVGSTATVKLPGTLVETPKGVKTENGVAEIGQGTYNFVTNY